VNRLPGTIVDRMELPFLIGLQDQKLVLDRIRKQTQAGMKVIAAGGQNGVAVAMTPATAAQTSSATEDDQAINNRCTTTTTNYYLSQDPAVAPSPNGQPTPVGPTPIAPPAPSRSKADWWPFALLALLLLLCLAAGGWAWYLVTHPGPTPVNPVVVGPVVPVTPPAPVAPQQEWIMLR